MNLRNRKYEFSTALSKYFWYAKDKEGMSPQIKWQIVKRAKANTGNRNRCNLCLEEKLLILMLKNSHNLLNNCNKLLAKCKHKSKFL